MHVRDLADVDGSLAFGERDGAQNGGAADAGRPGSTALRLRKDVQRPARATSHPLGATFASNACA